MRLLQEQVILYVPNDGSNDNNDCMDESNPCKTWNYVTQIQLQSGDTIFFESGTFAPSNSPTKVAIICFYYYKYAITNTRIK